jgi:GNAT superfamily N-acetyltransferase
VEEIHRDRALLIEAAMGPEADLVKPRFARGCRCFAVLLDDSIAGYGWLSSAPEWIGEVELEIRPRGGEGYIWNCVTLAEHRRKGIFRSLLLGLHDAARKQGLQRLWIGSVAIPAERAVGPSGFRPALRFVSMAAAGLHVLRVARADDALGADAERVLAIAPGLHVRRARRVRH